MPKTIEVEDGKRIEFALVKYKERGYDKAEYHCYINEIDADGKTVNKYWRGFKNDYYTGAIYGDFSKRFIEDVEYRDKYNVKHAKQLQYKRVITEDVEGEKIEIDAEIYEVVTALWSAGYGTWNSCKGTAFTWRDHPSLEDVHTPVAYVNFVEEPKELIAALKGNKYIIAESGNVRICSSAREYNSMFPEIMLHAIAALKKETPS